MLRFYLGPQCQAFWPANLLEKEASKGLEHLSGGPESSHLTWRRDAFGPTSLRLVKDIGSTSQGPVLSLLGAAREGRAAGSPGSPAVRPPASCPCSTWGPGVGYSQRPGGRPRAWAWYGPAAAAWAGRTGHSPSVTNVTATHRGAMRLGPMVEPA